VHATGGKEEGRNEGKKECGRSCHFQGGRAGGRVGDERASKQASPRLSQLFFLFLFFVFVFYFVFSFPSFPTGFTEQTGNDMYVLSSTYMYTLDTLDTNTAVPIRRMGVSTHPFRTWTSKDTSGSRDTGGRVAESLLRLPLRPHRSLMCIYIHTGPQRRSGGMAAE